MSYALDSAIRIEQIEANGLSFEVHCCGTGSKLALCLHGFPEHAYSWRYQLPLLAKLGYRAWAPCLRGYGQTSRPAAVEAYDLDLLIEDVAALIDVAAAESTLLIGHDWGGAIAWMFALQQVRPLEQLIIMNLPHPLLFQQGVKRYPQFLRSWYILFFQLPGLPEWLLGRDGARPIGEAFRRMAIAKEQFPDEVLAVYRHNAGQPGALTAMLNYYRANFHRFMASPGDALAQCRNNPLTVATLMIWGETDSALGKELTYGTEELVEDFTIHYLPKVSHWVQQEAPEQTNQFIADWLIKSSDSGRSQKVQGS